jgi:hypothetical protein
MDVRLLIEQYTSFSLTIISPTLFKLADDKSILYFHDEERADLFFIRLNEFINTSFESPLDAKKKVSLLNLMEDFCIKYKHNDDFNKFLQTIKETKEFFFKKRFYKYYISPYDIVFEISFAELINFQSNYSKHSYYHLTIIKNKLKKHFKKNNISNYENEDYNEHLAYFKEAVLDDNLNFNQTHMVEKLGELFLSYWELLNSSYQNRIQDLIHDFIEKNGRLVQWKIDKPNDLTDIEEFFWTIKGLPKFRRNRLTDFIPKTWNSLIEKETNINNMIKKNR